MVNAHIRGWLIVFVGNVFMDGKWLYADTKTSTVENRPCKKCGQPSSAEGHDSCLGTVPGAISACCGHGAEKGFILRR